MVCIPYTYGVKCAYSQVNIGLQGTLLVLTLNNLPPPFSFFGSPTGMPPKKEKSRGSAGQLCLPPKEQEVFWSDDKDHSAKQKTQAIYPDILLVFIVELAKI